MDFGIFDHVDASRSPQADYYEERLASVELYDRAGFHAYHIAEHHGTPLGMAPSPSVFLAAVAQRTKRLRFGPMIYALPLYHPLRMIEEICMLDQMSGGRLDVGFGRGASPIELELFGADPAEAREVYDEALAIVVQGLRDKTVSFKGKHFSFDNVPMEIEPLQKPHPPLWYGVHSPQAGERAAQRGMHVIGLDTVPELVPCFQNYRKAWRETRGDAPLPKMGIGRFVFVGDSAREALAIARRAYAKWHASFVYLSQLMGWKHRHPRPAEFDAIAADGRAVAGTPDAVVQYVQEQMRATGANYFVGQFAFGDLSQDEAERTIDLFSRQVMPALRAALPANA
jgi:alkanesulfonate monooxygenase SsuD/methylene tetrahydromethanopterin reductase-like flavin-dependent oxidoreductase (luciferase family)